MRLERSLPFVLFVFVATTGVWAQSGRAPDTIETRITAIQEAQVAVGESLKRLEAQMAELRQILLSATARAPELPKNIALKLDGLPTKGDVKASLVLIEFSDFQCPYCRAFVRETLPQLQREYIDTGKVQLAFWHSPLAELHPRAEKASEAAECALRQDRFWEMHDSLFADTNSFDDQGLLRRADALALDRDKFVACLNGETTATIVRRRSLAKELGVTGTPTFFLGQRQPDGSVRTARRLEGTRDIAVFRTFIENRATDSAAPR